MIAWHEWIQALGLGSPASKALVETAADGSNVRKRRRIREPALHDLGRFNAFAEALSSSQEDTEVLKADEFVTEVWGLCLAALGAAPTKEAVREEVSEVLVWKVPLTQFLAMTVARSACLDGLLGPVLSRRLRAYLHATFRPVSDDPPFVGPAPGEAPWELVAALLEAKEDSRARAKSRSTILDIHAAGARDRKKVGLFLYSVFFGGGLQHM